MNYVDFIHHESLPKKGDLPDFGGTRKRRNHRKGYKRYK